MSNAPVAYLFCNGNAMFFDEHGEQMIPAQQLGLCGLHGFVERYPDAPVHWSVWQGDDHLLDRESLRWLLRYIRRRPGKRPPWRRNQVQLDLTFQRKRKPSQADRLLELLSDCKWHSNFELANSLYGPRPCGRLGARIFDLQRKGHVIEARHGENDRAKYWYRLI